MSMSHHCQTMPSRVTLYCDNGVDWIMVIEFTRIRVTFCPWCGRSLSEFIRL